MMQVASRPRLLPQKNSGGFDKTVMSLIALNLILIKKKVKTKANSNSNKIRLKVKTKTKAKGLDFMESQFKF